MTSVHPRESAAARDAADPLRGFREHFAIAEEDLVYLDGNSLGPLPTRTAAHLQHVVTQEWGQGLIRSWNDAGWFDKPRTLGDRIGRLVGAGPGQVVVCDSTSVNVFKALTAALGLRPGRDVVVGDRDNFPTDLYMMQGATAGTHSHRLISAEGPSLADVLDEEVAAVVLTHVDYRTGRMYDMAAVTAQVQAAGALMIWDLCHSAGALPIDLDGCGADFAVGCTYKYLNGGPGAPAFLFVAEALQAELRSPIWGWFAQTEQFAMDRAYEPVAGIGRFLAGTPPILQLAAVEEGVTLTAEAGIDRIRDKSVALTELIVALHDAWLAPLGFTLGTPREPSLRGSHVSLRHPDAWPITRALAAAGVTPDFRGPDSIRLGVAPLYTRFADVFDALDRLRGIVERGDHERVEAAPARVT